ncbi:glycosyltransferase [Brachyspira intermedia]|uniref:glycosyltransferase n=1 Tax=Brachyspira intermedia TaxID=84377 RepID=UPI003005B7CA
MKKAIIIFPLNFLKNSYMGCSAYVLSISQYLKSKNFLLDLFIIDSSKDSIEEYYYYNKQHNNLFNKIFMYKSSQTYTPEVTNLNLFKINIFSKSKIIDIPRQIEYYQYKFFGIKLTIKKNIEHKYNYTSSAWVKNDYLIDEFNKIINENNYNFINIPYVGASFLIENSNIPTNTKTIYTMHDLNFFQKLYRDNISINDVGYFFTEEINSLNIYNKIFCVSSDEKNFISRFFQNKEIEYIPYSIPEIILPNVKKEIDLLFIGAENPYNLEAILWFLNEVFPNLKDDINLTVCGDVINMYDFSKIIENKNVNLINSVDNLDDLYSKTKIAIVPMLRGTGIKIKTIDAMARGIPVVASILGVDGIEDKRESGCLVADNSNDFEFYVNRLINDKKFYIETVDKMKKYFNKYISLESNSVKLNKIFEIEG